MISSAGSWPSIICSCPAVWTPPTWQLGSRLLKHTNLTMAAPTWQLGIQRFRSSIPTRPLHTGSPWNCALWVMGRLTQGSAVRNLAQQRPRLLNSCQGLCAVPASLSCSQRMLSLNI